MVFLHAFAGIFSLLLVVAMGWLLSSRGWFSESTCKLLPRLITNISLPPFLACTIIADMPRTNLPQMFYGSLLPLLSITIMFAIAFAIGKFMHVSKRRFGLFCACIANSNTIYIGIPVNLALFGPNSLPYVLLYYFPSTFFFWTVGNYFISRDESPGHAKDSAFHWQKIISPPMYGFITGLLVICLDCQVPDFIFQAARIIGEMTTPLALIFIGITLQKMDFSRLHLHKDIVIAALGRMVASPLLLWALLPLFPLPPLAGKVFVIQSSLPVLMQVAILSAYYDTDPDYGSIMVCFTTILCIITVPVYMALLH